MLCISLTWVELGCNSRTELLSFVLKWKIHFFRDLRNQGRMQIFRFFAVNHVFEKEIEGFRSWECRDGQSVNLLYILDLADLKKVQFL